MVSFPHILVVIVVGVAMAATGCGSGTQSSSAAPKSGAQKDTASASTKTAPNIDTRKNEALRAIRTAEKRLTNTQAYDIEGDHYRGERVWEVKVARGTTKAYELDISADGRKVIRTKRKSKIDDDVRKLAEAKVTISKALQAAAKRARGTSFDEAEIDRTRSGQIIWELSFKRSARGEIEIEVDARTGKVLSTKHDD